LSTPGLNDASITSPLVLTLPWLKDSIPSFFLNGITFEGLVLPASKASLI